MRSNGCRLDRVCKMPLAAPAGATRRREARGRVAVFALRPAPHSLRLGRSEGIKRLSRHKRCPLRATPLFHGSLDPLSTSRRPVAAFSRRGPACPFLTFSKRAVGPFLAGAGRRAESSAFRSTAGRQRAEGEASARCFTKTSSRPGSGTLRNRLCIVLYSCMVSYQYEIQ